MVVLMQAKAPSSNTSRTMDKALSDISNSAANHEGTRQQHASSCLLTVGSANNKRLDNEGRQFFTGCGNDVEGTFANGNEGKKVSPSTSNANGISPFTQQCHGLTPTSGGSANAKFDISTVGQKRAADAISNNTISTSTKPKFKIRLYGEVMNETDQERRTKDKIRAEKNAAYKANRRRKEKEKLEKARNVLALKETAYMNAVNRNDKDESIKSLQQEAEAAKQHVTDAYESSHAGREAKRRNIKEYYDGYVIDKRTILKGLGPYLEKQKEYTKGSCKKAKQVGNILVGEFKVGTSPEKVAEMIKAMCV